MTDSTTFNEVRPPGSRVKVEYPFTQESLTAAFRKALNWNRPFADRPNDSQLTGISAVAGLGGSQLGTLLRPIATPLVMSGFDLSPNAWKRVPEQFFVPTGGVPPMRAASAVRGALKPADAVGVMLVGATSRWAHRTVPTSTRSLYAFGHPVNLGPIDSR